MLREMIESVLKSIIENKYTHLKMPSCVYAKITSVRIHDAIFEYNIKILKEDKTIDDKFSEIPSVKSDVRLENNDIACVLMLYGTIPFIVRKVIS